MPRTSFRGFFSLLRALYKKNDLGQFLHAFCLFWSSAFRVKNILLEAHSWSNKSFLISCLVLHFVAFSAFYVLYTRRTTPVNFCMLSAFFALRRSEWKISCWKLILGQIRAFWSQEEESEAFKALRFLELVLIEICMCARLCLMLAFFLKWFNHLREPLLVLFSCLVLHFVAFSAFYVLYTRRTTSANFCMFLAFFGLRRSDWKNILLEAHTWSNNSFWMSERRIWKALRFLEFVLIEICMRARLNVWCLHFSLNGLIT